jgi:sterol desaturase/sphingolipid hydroxylase (fatty acid hydroxylase superfamily)
VKIPWGSLQVLGSLIVILLILGWEALAPTRPRPRGTLRRWARNLGIGGLGILATHALPGGALAAVAAWGSSEGLGLLKNLPMAWALPITVLVLDLSLWAQHRLSHHWAWLWRLHRVHHGDLAMDLTTAFRFHPLELAVSLAWKALVVLALGGPMAGVLLFESLLLVGNSFEHANGRLPPAMDSLLRWILVTPALHAIHHSPDPRDQNTNYGFFFIWWDRIFQSLRSHTEALGPQAFGLGDGRDRNLLELLRQPFEPVPANPSGH